MSKKYIERKALFSYPIRRDYYDKKNGNIHFISGIESAFEYVESLPIADVQEIRHGKWIKSKDERKCSLCGYFYFTDTKSFNYCPNCGAKMDKE